MRWRWSKNKVIRFLNELAEDGQIAMQKSNVTTCITILNYDIYQNDEYAEDEETNTQTNIQTDTQKGRRRVRKKKNKNNTINYDTPDVVGSDTHLPPDNGISKGVFEWHVKNGIINFSNAPSLLDMLDRKGVQSQILSLAIPFAPTAETHAWMNKYPIQPQNASEYQKMLMPYGIAKTLHTEMVKKWDIDKYSYLKKANTTNWVNTARMMLHADKRSPSVIKDVIQWLYENPKKDFWRNTIRGMEGFRKHFEQILAEMESLDSVAEQQNEHSTTFSQKDIK